MSSGWIKVHRKLKEHWIWSDPIKFQWWLIMLLEVNHKPCKMQLGLQIIEIKRGQSAKSLRTWATIFGCTPKTVSAFFKMLESDKMLVITTIGKGKQSTTIINITKYEDYQGTEETQDTTLSKRKLPTIEEGKNEKKDIGKFKVPTLEEVIIYFDENGYSKEAATKAFNYYNNLGWKNSKGNQVLNWKNTMLNNWFTPANEKKKYHLYPKLMN